MGATTIRDGVRAGLPFLVPTAAIGISFGVLARSLGWDAPAPIVMSLIVFSGSAQFAAASVLGDGGTVFAAVVAAALVSARFLPMGIALAPSLEGRPARRALEGQAVVDSSWALANNQGRFDRELLIGATLPQYAGWVGGTVIGALAASTIGDPSDLGLDAMFPAFFLAIVVPDLRTSRRARAVALGGASLALALTPLLPPGLPIVAASAAAVAGGLWR